MKGTQQPHMRLTKYCQVMISDGQSVQLIMEQRKKVIGFKSRPKILHIFRLYIETNLSLHSYKTANKQNSTKRTLSVATASLLGKK